MHYGTIHVSFSACVCEIPFNLITIDGLPHEACQLNCVFLFNCYLYYIQHSSSALRVKDKVIQDESQTIKALKEVNNNRTCIMYILSFIVF